LSEIDINIISRIYFRCRN